MSEQDNKPDPMEAARLAREARMASMRITTSDAPAAAPRVKNKPLVGQAPRRYTLAQDAPLQRNTRSAAPSSARSSEHRDKLAQAWRTFRSDYGLTNKDLAEAWTAADEEHTPRNGSSAGAALDKLVDFGQISSLFKLAASNEKTFFDTLQPYIDKFMATLPPEKSEKLITELPDRKAALIEKINAAVQEQAEAKSLGHYRK